MSGAWPGPTARRPRIGLAFNQKPTARPEDGPDDLYAEWDEPGTIAAVEHALRAAGDVIRLEATSDFPQRLHDARPDIVFNIAEGLVGPNRESHVPSFCEFWNIPCSGSDPLTLGLCSDKSRAKEILAQHGIPTAEFAVIDRGGKVVSTPAPPVIVKPVHEGSSKGITQRAFCRTAREVRSAVAAVHETYRQPALVERWLPGREFTCAVIGNGDGVRMLPIVELDFSVLPPDALPLYSYEAKWEWDTPARPLEIHHCPARIPPSLAARIETAVRATYRVLRCRDWSRIDLRCDESGEPHILEINPLPGINPDPAVNSCFPTAARAAGLAYDDMIRSVLDAAIERCGMAVAT